MVPQQQRYPTRWQPGCSERRQSAPSVLGAAWRRDFPLQPCPPWPPAAEGAISLAGTTTSLALSDGFVRRSKANQSLESVSVVVGGSSGQC